MQCAWEQARQSRATHVPLLVMPGGSPYPGLVGAVPGASASVVQGAGSKAGAAVLVGGVPQARAELGEALGGLALPVQDQLDLVEQRLRLGLLLLQVGLEHGAATLLDVPVLGHRCDNPLCQHIGSGHVQASSYVENSREYAGRRHTMGAPLRDSRGARGRSRTLRDLLRLGASASELKAAMDAGLTLDAAQLALWDDDEPSPTTVNGTAATMGSASATEAGAA